jgi:anti-sigma-K factor RskA
MTDSVLLYAAGALDVAEAEEVRQHLASGCPRCAGLLAEAEATVALLAMTLPVEKPSAAVKGKLMGRIGSPAVSQAAESRPMRIGPVEETQKAPWWAPIFIPSAIAAVVAAGLAIFFSARMQPVVPPPSSSNNEAVIGMLTSQVEQSQKEIAALRSGQTSQTVSWAAAPNLKFLWLDGTDQQPGAGGRIFWDTKSGTWHFFAQGVKAPPTGETYELWFVSSDGKMALPAGEFDPTPQGDASLVTKVPDEIAGKLTIGAVTDEPSGKAITAPSGKFQFKGTVQ